MSDAIDFLCAGISNESKDVQLYEVSIPVPKNSISKDKWDSDIGDVEVQVQSVENDSHSTPPLEIPRSRRRGLFGRFTILAEVEEPKDYPRRTKWFITFVVAMAAVAASMGSTIIFPSLQGITIDLNTTATITNLSVALYMLAIAICPLWWSSYSEALGRRTIYIVSFALFVLWNILSALSRNIEMLMVMRVLSGGAAASVQAVGAGTIADIWESQERGRAMGMFYLGPIMGLLLAPIIGGVLDPKWGWRSTQWFLAIYGAFVLISLVFALPETLKSQVSFTIEEEEHIPGEEGPTSSRVNFRQVMHHKTKNTVKILKRTLLDPLKIILHLRFPVVLLTICYASLAFGSLYVLNVSLQARFSNPPYNFSTLEVGLAYIPTSIGFVISSIFGGKWTDKIMAREAKKAGYDEYGKLVYRPEYRLRENAWIAAFIYPAALMWYGWTVEKGVFWVVPLIATFFLGVGSMLINTTNITMLTEFMPQSRHRELRATISFETSSHALEQLSPNP